MKDQHVHKIEISAKTIVFVVVLLILLQAVWVVRELLFSFVIAFIVMSAFNPVVTWFNADSPLAIATLQALVGETADFIKLSFLLLV